MNVEEAKEISKRALDELAAALERGQSQPFKAYLKAMGRLHRYSPRNVLLIRAQRPGATNVAGFTTWKRLGRSVLKGERGIAILAPVVRRRTGIADEELEPGNAGGSDRGNRQPAPAVSRFRTAFVFDASQTTGAPIPAPALVGGDPGRFLERLKTFVAERSIELQYLWEITPARGVSTGGRIILVPNMAPPEEFSTLVHELAHELLHDRNARLDHNALGLRELEAEAVAFVVCQGIGLDATTASADYILHYAGDRNGLARSLDRVQRVASEILSAISDV